MHRSLLTDVLDPKLLNHVLTSVLDTSSGQPYPILTNLKLHVEGGSVTKDMADLVSAWLPLSNTVIIPAQPTSSRQPLFKENEINGLPILEFGISAGLNNTSFFDLIFSTADEFSIFMVCTESTDAIPGYILTGTGLGGTPAIISKFDPGVGIVNFEFFNSAEREAFSASATGFNLLSVTRKNNISLKMWFNGNKVVDQVADNSKVTSTFDMIGTVNGTPNDYTGKHAGISGYDSVLVENDVDSVNSYWLRKYLPGKLPVQGSSLRLHLEVSYDGLPKASLVNVDGGDKVIDLFAQKGPDCAQLNEPDRGQYLATGINGIPAIDFLPFKFMTGGASIGDIVPPFTIMCAIKPGDDVGGHHIMDFGNKIFGTNGTAYTFISSAVQTYTTNTGQFSIGETHILTIVMDSSFNVSFYKNGNLIATINATAGAPTVSAADYILGDSGSQFFNGIIGGLAIWEKNMSLIPDQFLNAHKYFIDKYT